MKNIRASIKASKKLVLRKDTHWRILSHLATDLGLTDLCPSSPFVDTGNVDHKDLISKSLRQRNVEGLESMLTAFDPQRMIENLKGEKFEAYNFFALYQISSFLKKYPLKKDTDLRAKALETFRRAEKICNLFNTENYRALLSMNDRHPDYLGIVEEIKSDILGLIGEVPNINSIFYNAKHGPGTSIGPLYSRGKSTNFFKWSNLPYSCTADVIPYAMNAISADARWIGALDDWYRRSNGIDFLSPIDPKKFWDSVLVTVPGSKITTVPKSYKTDRTIAIEPVLNVYFQLGVDTVIKRRLKSRWSLDLGSQEANQRAALEGSVTNNIATIDLSMASDTVSLKLCELLLPPLWYNLLLDLRCPCGTIEDEMITFDKISSMGNGYTFAIETLIFSALARCAIRRTKSEESLDVYGDDITIASSASGYLITLLNLCGFQINKDKTFISGPFRESCGKDYFLGHLVRPVFLKRPIVGVRDLFYIHNSLWNLERTFPWFWGVSFTKTLSYIRSLIPRFFRDNFYGPATDGVDVSDSYLFSDRQVPRDTYNQGFHLAIVSKAIVFKPKYRDFFFLKLMCNLKGVQPKLHKWDKKGLPDSGNAFDIVKRDFTQDICVKRSTW